MEHITNNTSSLNQENIPLNLSSKDQLRPSSGFSGNSDFGTLIKEPSK